MVANTDTKVLVSSPDGKSDFALFTEGKITLIRKNGAFWEITQGENDEWVWLASINMDWPEVVARGLRVVTGMGLNHRTKDAVGRHEKYERSPEYD